MRMRRLTGVLIATLLPATLSLSAATGQALKPLTSEVSIETPRLENAAGGASDSEPISYSPNRSRYLVRIAQDDLNAGGTWVTFYSGSTDSLDGAKPLQIARLFTTGRINRRNGSIPPTHPGSTGVIWIDEDRFLFLWDPDGISQLMIGNARGGTVEQLTHNSTGVTGFRLIAGTNGSSPVVVYSLFPELPDEKTAMELPDGFAVKSADLLNTVLAGEFTSASAWESTTPRLVDLETKIDRSLECSGRPCNSYALTSFMEAKSWSGKYLAGIFDSDWAFYWRILKIDRENGALIDQFPQIRAGMWSSKALWAPKADRVIIGPVELDLGKGNRFFVELDMETRQHWLLPIEVPADAVGIVSPIEAVRWRDDEIVELDSEGAVLAFRKRHGEWRRLADVPPLRSEHRAKLGVRIEVRQDLDVSPRIVAVDHESNRERLLMDVTPALKNYSLGKVEYVEFRDREGTIWEGRFTYPVDYRPEMRYPMVITTSGAKADAKTFSLVGIYDHIGPLYASQALANRGIAVLSLSEGNGTAGRGMTGVSGTPREGEKITMGFEAAIDHFVRLGIARPDKVGLAGFSRTGSYVQQAITRSSYPFAAAISSDNVNFGYVQAILQDQIGAEFADVNGAPASGEGLKRWLEQAPPFNAHKVKTPLRIEVVSGGAAGIAIASEMFAQLRYLRKPVDMVLVPYPGSAIHAPQMPVQKLFSQGGTVDWFDFWLNDRENPDAKKTEQNARWRELRASQLKHATNESL